MQIHDLKPVHKNRPTMLVGRGGKRGKTSGRGTKGQNARAGRKKRPELRDFIKRIPKLRGRGVNSMKSIADKVVVINLGDMETVFNKGGAVTATSFIEKKLVKKVGGKIPRIKVLSGGDFTQKIELSGVAVSAGAKVKIEKAGGSVKI
jgi:large subunit ribosomal protein L15